MAFFEWNDDLSVKIKEIDDQHKKLISVLNSFYDGLDNKSSSEYLLKILEELEDYTNYHFNAEEQSMEKCDYENSDEHKALHKTFVDKVADIKGRLTSGKLITVLEITTFLKDWLKDHIMVEDQKYVECFKGKL